MKEGLELSIVCKTTLASQQRSISRSDLGYRNLLYRVLHLVLIVKILKKTHIEILSLFRSARRSIMVSRKTQSPGGKKCGDKAFNLLDDLIIVEAALEHFRKVKTLKKTKLKSKKLKIIGECLKINSEVVYSRWKKLKTWLKETGETSKMRLNVRKTEIKDYWESQVE